MVLFIYKNYLLIFSCLYPTFPVLYHNQMCVSFPFVRNAWILPQYHHHQDTSIFLLYLYIGYKTDPYGDRNVGRFFCEDKGYYGSMSSPNSTFMEKNSNGPNIILPCNVLRHGLYSPSQMFRYIIKHSIHSTYISP